MFVFVMIRHAVKGRLDDVRTGRAAIRPAPVSARSSRGLPDSASRIHSLLAPNGFAIWPVYATMVRVTLAVHLGGKKK